MYIQDFPMKCCGLVEAYQFSVSYAIAGKDSYPTVEEQWDILFNAIERHQRTLSRNCALITLSSEQEDALEQAQKRGFKIVHKFINPNSENDNYILAKTLWNTLEDYEKEGYGRDSRKKVRWTRAYKSYSVNWYDSNPKIDPLKDAFHPVVQDEQTEESNEV
jgi:hypothetical protein